MKFLSAALLALVTSAAVQCCQVPVFRFALERWPADPFRLLVTSHGPLESSLQTDLDDLAESLQRDPRPVNLELEVIVSDNNSN